MPNEQMGFEKKRILWSYAGLFYTTVTWGSTFFMLRDAVEITHPLIITGYRFLIAAVLLGSFLLITKKRLWADLRYGFGLSLLVLLVYIPQAIGLQFTSATNSGFITGLFVAFVPFFAWIAFRKKPETQNFVAVFVAVFGLWFLTGGFESINVGDLLTLITAVTYALHVLFTGILVKKVDPIALTFQQFFFTGIFSVLAAAIINAELAVTNGKALAVILYFALIPTLSALVIQALSQKYVSEIKTAIIFCFEPVFAALFAWSIGNEVLSIQQLVGGLLIFSAMIVSELRFKKF